MLLFSLINMLKLLMRVQTDKKYERNKTLLSTFNKKSCTVDTVIKCIGYVV